MEEAPNWLEIVRSAVTKEDWQQIVSIVIEQAKKGDRYARDFLAECVLPKERGASGAATVKEVRLVFEKRE